MANALYHPVRKRRKILTIPDTLKIHQDISYTAINTLAYSESNGIESEYRRIHAIYIRGRSSGQELIRSPSYDGCFPLGLDGYLA